MSLVPLNSSMSNIQQFVPSLFDSSVRSLSNVTSAIAAGRLDYTFADSNSMGMILQAWLAAWQRAENDTYDTTAYSHCPASDASLMAILATYIRQNSAAQLCIPHLAWTNQREKDTYKYVYTNSGYERLSFFNGTAWNYGTISSSGSVSKGSYAHATVADFLKYLFLGAHFVVVSSSGDYSNGTSPIGNFYNQLRGLTQYDWSWDKFNSHYTNVANTSGYYWLSINQDAEPSTNPLACAFLFGQTADTSATNTFFQLEGWQNHAPYVGGWHAADYDSHEQTLWNFSTYGACPYSEKRSTPLFLGGANFSLSLDATTHMPLYNGAGSLQGWMNPSLLSPT